VKRVYVVCAVCTVALAAQGGGQRATAEPPPGLRVVEASLPDWLERRPHAAAGSGVDVTPTEAVRAAFAAAVELCLAEAWEEAAAQASAAGYELIALVDRAGGGGFYPALVERDEAGIGPTLVFNPTPRRDLIAEGPHASSEAFTGTEVGMLLQQHGARAALIEGADRCATTELSGCDGETVACDQASAPYRASDVAHSANTLFQAAHQVLAASFPDALVVQLHGMRADATWLVASDGSGDDRQGDTGIAARVRDHVRAALGDPVYAVSCQDPADRVYPYRNLCATSNVQGRWLAGSDDACTLDGPLPSTRFLHLEQTLELTNLSPPGGPVLDAIAAEVPVLDGAGPDSSDTPAEKALPGAFRPLDLPHDPPLPLQGCAIAPRSPG
jgi:hypothetical protein